MPETGENQQSSFFESLKHVLRDGVDYLTSGLTLLQARMTGMALSAILFLVLLLLALLLGITAFILLTVAIGMWLANLTGHAGWSLVILASFYALLAGLTGAKAIQSINSSKP